MLHQELLLCQMLVQSLRSNMGMHCKASSQKIHDQSMCKFTTSSSRSSMYFRNNCATESRNTCIRTLHAAIACDADATHLCYFVLS
eukprot:2131866-Amphidinium_carterae.1